MRTHVSHEALPHDRGLAFGRAQADAVRATVGAYERLLGEVQGLDGRAIRDLGLQVEQRLRHQWPHLADEIAGIAGGAAVDEATLMAVNARTELLAGAMAPECSTVGVLPQRSGGGALLAQNWDWHPGLAASRVVWTVVEPDGRWLTTLTEAGMLAKIGLNSRGLGVCLNILGSSRDGGLDGTPIHVLLRLLLQGCDELAQVEELLEENEVSASSCVTVGAAAEGAMVSFELSPSGPARVAPEEGLLLHTNHFLDPSKAAEDVYRHERPGTLVRLEELERRLRRGPMRLDADLVKACLRSHQGEPTAICCHDSGDLPHADRSETLASVCLYLDELRFEVSDGAPCCSAYQATNPPAQAVGAGTAL